MTTNATPGPVEVELKPCPFCGTKRDYYNADAPNFTRRYWTVKCDGCDAQGPPFSVNSGGEAEAITAWNTRIEAARPVSGETVGWKVETSDGGFWFTAEPENPDGFDCELTQTPLYAARPVQSELVEAIAELQLAAFLAGRGSIRTKDSGHTVVSLPGPTMDDYRRMAEQVLLAKATGDGL
jgi:Lar family restriction alleviation protein